MRSRNAVLLLTLVALVVSCAAPRRASSPAARESALRVGTNGDSPPYAFRRGGQLVGLEIDLARELGTALGRQVEVADLPWDGLFDALLGRKVDVVMAGVTVTPDREVRLAFAQPYLRTTLTVLIRRQDANRFRSRATVCESPIDVGVVAGTTGEKQLRERCPAMVPRLYPTAGDAVGELRGYRIDAVVHDGPVVAWLQSRYEAELQILPTQIADERLAWALRPEDAALKGRLDAALTAMRANGTLDRILGRWVAAGDRLPPS